MDVLKPLVRRPPPKLAEHRRQHRNEQQPEDRVRKLLDHAWFGCRCHRFHVAPHSYQYASEWMLLGSRFAFPRTTGNWLRHRLSNLICRCHLLATRSAIDEVDQGEVIGVRPIEPSWRVTAVPLPGVH